MRGATRWTVPIRRDVALSLFAIRAARQRAHARSIAEVMENAFRSAEADRPGAVFVSLPQDVMEGGASCVALDVPSLQTRGPGSESSLREAARLIAGSKKCVVFLGMLASKPENAEAVRAFVRQTGIPAAGTFQAAGTMSSDLLRLFAGRVGQTNNSPGDEILAAADVIVTVGYDAIEYEPSLWNHGRRARIVHIDVDRADIDNDYSPAVEVIGDIAASLEALGKLLSPVSLAPDFDRFLTTLTARRAARLSLARTLTARPIHPLRIVMELQDLLTPDVTVCSDMGSFHLWLAHYLFTFRARQLLISNGQQTLGVALPWAIASCLVRSGEKTLSLSGDGGFLFSAMELETAVRLKLNFVHMVWIDGSYDMVAVQERAKYHRVAGTKLGPVDVAKYAEAFGATGLMISSPDEIRPTLRRAFETAGPVIVGLAVDYSDNHLLFDPPSETLLSAPPR